MSSCTSPKSEHSNDQTLDFTGIETNGDRPFLFSAIFSRLQVSSRTTITASDRLQRSCVHIRASPFHLCGSSRPLLQRKLDCFRPASAQLATCQCDDLAPVRVSCKFRQRSETVTKPLFGTVRTTTWQHVRKTQRAEAWRSVRTVPPRRPR